MEHGWPNPGELNRRVKIYRWQDEPTAFGLAADDEPVAERAAMVRPIAGGEYWGEAQTGEKPTHRVWIRYEALPPEEITGEHVVEFAGRRFRVLRTLDVGDARRYTMIECKDLGAIL